MPDSIVLSYFEKWDGYKPSDPNTDAGGVGLDVLNYWQKTSFDQHKLIG